MKKKLTYADLIPNHSFNITIVSYERIQEVFSCGIYFCVNYDL